MRAHVRPRRGFTIVELLIVLAIVGVMLALSVPAIQQSRAQAQANQCKNNLKQIGLALHNYHATFATFPPGWIAKDLKADTGPCYGWGACLLPFVDQAPLFNQMDFGKAPDVANELVQKRIPAYRCPADTSDDINPVRDEYGTSNYSGNYGDLLLPGSVDADPKARGTFYWNSRVTFRDIPDGSSNVFAIGERCVASAAGIWMGSRTNQQAGDCVTSCNHRVRLNRGLDSFSSRHEGGAHFLMCDGAVRFISNNIDSREGPPFSTETATTQVAGGGGGGVGGAVAPGSNPPKGTYQKLAHRSDGQAVGDF